MAEANEKCTFLIVLLLSLHNIMLIQELLDTSDSQPRNGSQECILLGIQTHYCVMTGMKICSVMGS